MREDRRCPADGVGMQLSSATEADGVRDALD